MSVLRLSMICFLGRIFIFPQDMNSILAFCAHKLVGGVVSEKISE